MKITPNIGVWPEGDPDPLGRFLASLHDLKRLDVRLALPGHKSLITDWAGRVDELLAHHETRLAHTLAAVEGGATVYETARRIFDSGAFSPHEWRFALAETLAHLDYLERRGKVRRQDADMLRFRAV
jgi:glyoxylase-like metal-dependent hydrolase (beta-lactamase superfamily II)